MTNDNSGPAFPFTEMHTHGNPYTQWKGMTMRDYFAAKALQGLLAAWTHGVPESEAIAQAAYSYADDMLKARAQ